MSTLGISSQDKIYKKSFHQRNGSDELDVFEASSYFSTANDIFSYNDPNRTQKNIREANDLGSRGGRKSLDLPLMSNTIAPQSYKKENDSKVKKIKPPSSPGGKLASFLNSLFTQTPSRKKALKSTLQYSTKDKDESLGGRKRRSSISHFGSSFSKDSKSVYSSPSVSGLRSPPPYLNTDTPKKSYNAWNSSFSDIGGRVTKPSSLQNEVKFIQEFKSITNGVLQKPIKKCDFSEKNKEAKEIKEFDEVDFDAESDSSSDLFELENYDLGCFSSELPVYETTHMENIKREPPISSGAM